MGTSLSGLTPATTFDGLLKTSDNEPLDGTLKTIGTGDGTDSILQLSNSALQVNGAATINGAQMTIVGSGDDNTTSALLVQNINNQTALEVFDSGRVYLKGNKYQFGNTDATFDEVGLFVNGAQSTFKGSGTTSATTSLLVQNSEGSNLLQANDDGVVLIGPENIYKNHLLELKGSGSNSEMLLRLQSNFNGGGGYTGIAFTNSTNGGGISSSIRGYRESDHYAIALNFGSNEGVDVLRAKNTGEVGIGETTPTARLHVKGSGNDNTTTSLLVQNSDGDDLMGVNDLGDFNIYGTNEVKILNSSAQNRLFSINPTNHSTVELQVRGDNENNLLRTNSSADSVGIGLNNSTARLQVKGSGTSSGTTALLVQNSAGTDLLKVQDDGQLTTKAIDTNNSNIVAGAGILYAKGFNAKRVFAFSHKSVINVAETPTVGTSGDAFVFTATLPYAPTSGNETLTIINASPTINQTGGANGITRGVYVNPTLTSAADFRAIETTAGNVVFGNLPTSATGLPTGAIWNDGGTLKIV